MIRRVASTVAVAAATLLAACGSDQTSEPPPPPPTVSSACPAITPGPVPAALTLPRVTPPALHVSGNGLDTVWYESEIAVRGTVAYTSTWGRRHQFGNRVNVWDVSGNVPVLIDSLTVSNATTTGDVEISDDGKLLVVASEPAPGSIAIFDLTNPRHPTPITQFSDSNTFYGVHTAKLGRVNGTLYGFLSIDPNGTVPARLVIVDLSDPGAPRDIFSKVTGEPYVHDTFARDGLLFVALWNAGIEIWDIGGCGSGATPANPKVLGGTRTLGGETHNVWWYHDASGSKRFAFVGEEGPGALGALSKGDIHVLDVSDLSKPKEVAFYHVDGAGTHNFSVDETNGVLYAAYYNAGVRALDVRGDLGTCPASQQAVDAATNLSRCDLRLMGRELATGLTDLNRQVYIWGVQYANGTLYASDMLNGIWKLGAAK